MAYGPQPMTAPAGAIILNVGDNISAIVNAAPAGATFFFEPGVYHDALSLLRIARRLLEPKVQSLMVQMFFKIGHKAEVTG